MCDNLPLLDQEEDLESQVSHQHQHQQVKPKQGPHHISTFTHGFEAQQPYHLLFIHNLVRLNAVLFNICSSFQVIVVLAVG